MNYFICALDKMHCWLGIPAEEIERLIPSRLIPPIEANSTIEPASYCISLPELIKLKDKTTPHGLVLKTQGLQKTVLLTPKIEYEQEILEENVQVLPKVFAGGVQYFRGVFFSNEKMIIILDPKKLPGT